ncbi:SGNH/GDSL hydrolase family protein [Streptomyces sp. NPDC088745]|uniref:SGNH/GDSL hydrolase family protein n=1 Tax=Streptomyces sp. NPDC088745 TaxID=3365884 RepID=UPI0037FE2D48
MRESGTKGPARRLRAAAAAASALLALVAGCSDGGAREGAGPAPARSTAKPSAKPTPTWDRSPSSLVAVGDSITRGFDACEVLADCPQASWATGTHASVRSLAVRLFGAAGAASRSWNLAVTGSRMADLPRQTARAVGHRPELITVMTGANDACRSSVAQMTPVADFRRSFERALKEVRTELPRTQVYVASVPDLKRLWSLGRGNPLGKQVWGLGICPSMLGDADAADAAAVARREAVRERVVAYNGVLAEVCGRDARCRYDGGAVFDYAFTGAQLSQWDFFHPGVNGQNQLAALAHQRITAPD